MNFRKSLASTTVSCVPQNDHINKLYILCLYTNFENRVTNLKILIQEWLGENDKEGKLL